MTRDHNCDLFSVFRSNDFEFHMKKDYRLLFGPMAGTILALGIGGLALMIPGYNHVHQTVSEIGEIGSPARFPFAIMLCCVAACILVFAAAVRDRSVAAGHSQLAAYLIGFMALSAVGVGVFAYPHPLHNVFGLSELIGYQAPLFLALTWRRDPRARRLVSLSLILYLLICIAIALNLSSLDRQGLVWAYVKPVYGLAQRALFAAWFGWCAVVGLLCFKRNGKGLPASTRRPPKMRLARRLINLGAYLNELKHRFNNRKIN
jgi:hypothetical membrane protein